MKPPNHDYDDLAFFSGLLTMLALTAALAVPVYFAWRYMTAVDAVIENFAGRVGL